MTLELARDWALAAAPLALLGRYALPPQPPAAAISLPAGLWRLLGRVSGDHRRGRRRLPLDTVLRWLGWAALILALSGPYLRGPALLPVSGHDLLLAVDLSASMASRQLPATAAPPSAAAKSAGAATNLAPLRHHLEAFVRARQGDRAGLIGFASEAFLLAPLSHDVAAVGAITEELDVGLAGRRTDIGQAIALAIKTLPAGPGAGANARNLILLSDGETNAGDIAVVDAAALARAAGLTVHAIAYGHGQAPAADHPLAVAARMTGGQLRAAATADGLARALGDIAATLPAAPHQRPDHLRRDLTFLPLAVALLAALGLAWRGEHEE